MIKYESMLGRGKKKQQRRTDIYFVREAGAGDSLVRDFAPNSSKRWKRCLDECVPDDEQCGV